MKANTIVLDGIDKFTENDAVLKQQRVPKEYLSTEEHNPYYHGPRRDECLLVKCRREKTYDNHYLDIYLCLPHQKECCRCGMEWEYYQKELYDPSKNLSS